MRVRCQCGKLASTKRRCKLCNSDYPMRHWHHWRLIGEEKTPETPTGPEAFHAHPHDGQGHDHPHLQLVQ